MQNVSDVYTAIAAGDYRAECMVVIDGVAFGEDRLLSVKTEQALFSDSPEIGTAVAGQVTVELLDPGVRFSRMAQIRPYVRICNEEQQSEWLPKGVYYIDTREITENPYGENTWKITGFDAMLKGERDCPMNRAWPAKDADVLMDIAKSMGVSIDSRTTAMIKKGYKIQLPTGYTCREVLGYIAAMYGGSFVISDTGQLRLVTVTDTPRLDRLLSDENGNPIEVGGVCILV